jgi:hypothetical protein
MTGMTEKIRNRMGINLRGWENWKNVRRIRGSASVNSLIISVRGQRQWQ